MTGLFYNEYPPATSCLRSMTFGRLAGAEIARNLGEKQGKASAAAVPAVSGPEARGMDEDVLRGEGEAAG